MKCKGILFIMLIGFTLIGCNNQNIKTNSIEIEESIQQSIQQEETEMISEIQIEETEVVSETLPETLRFVDAWGEYHETTINPNVEKHTFDWSKLVRKDVEVSYEDDTYYTRKGIDVSKYQGSIDWQKVKAAGYEFAIIRIVYRGYGESGSLKVDDTALKNIQGAKDAGLDVGVYVFSQAINEAEAVEEAELVLQKLAGIQLELPIVFDPELIRGDEARTDNVTGEQFTKNTIAFCEKIKEAGYEPMVYSNMIWEAELFDMEQIQQYPIWYADYEQIPQTPYRLEFWQYSEKGIVDGIDGYVDLNLQFCKIP